MKESEASVVQIDDDAELLELMLADHRNASEEHKASGRWAGYSDLFVNYLKEEGLRDFRSRQLPKDSPGTVLARFGAVDKNPSFDQPGRSPEEMYHVARSSFRGRGALALEQIPVNKVGNPEGFNVGGKFYTLSWLNFYCRYCYVSNFVEFNDQVIVEVGPGCGKQAELLKLAHPNLTLVLFDLPTQLYVCHQYLAKVFEGNDTVVDYRTTREFSSFADIQKGKINILPHWKFSMLKDQEFDVLWNAASFQEMGPDTAKQYLVTAGSARNLYLMYNIKYVGPSVEVGNRGVIDPRVIVTHDEVHRTDARLAVRPNVWLYCDSWWQRKSQPPP